MKGIVKNLWYFMFGSLLMLMNNVNILVGFLKYMMIEVRNLNYIYLGIMILIYLDVL